MKTLLNFISFVLIVGGIAGALRQWIDWIPPVFGFLRFVMPDGYALYGYLVATVLGLALAAAANTIRQG